jgi:hypothetical protein
MKYIKLYRLWESAEEIAAAKRMLALGLIEPEDFKQKLQELGLDKQYRSEFVAALKTLFADLGLEWRDWATARQADNGTVVLKLSPADAAEILFTADLPKGLSPAQETRYANIKRDMVGFRRQMEMETSLISSFEYWIFPGSLRNSGRIGQPTSNRQVVFDGLTEPGAAVARFMSQVALDAHGRSWRWRNT